MKNFQIEHFNESEAKTSYKTIDTTWTHKIGISWSPIPKIECILLELLQLDTDILILSFKESECNFLEKWYSNEEDNFFEPLEKTECLAHFIADNWEIIDSWQIEEYKIDMKNLVSLQWENVEAYLKANIDSYWKELSRYFIDIIWCSDCIIEKYSEDWKITNFAYINIVIKVKNRELLYKKILEYSESNIYYDGVTVKKKLENLMNKIDLRDEECWTDWENILFKYESQELYLLLMLHCKNDIQFKKHTHLTLSNDVLIDITNKNKKVIWIARDIFYNVDTETIEYKTQKVNIWTSKQWLFIKILLKNYWKTCNYEIFAKWWYTTNWWILVADNLNDTFNNIKDNSKLNFMIPYIKIQKWEWYKIW